MQLELQVREERELQQQAKPTADEASNNSTCVCVCVCIYIYIQDIYRICHVFPVSSIKYLQDLTRASASWQNCELPCCPRTMRIAKQHQKTPNKLKVLHMENVIILL